MQNIIKVDPPKFFEEIEKNKRIKNWKDLDGLLYLNTDIAVKEELRKYILGKEQSDRCVYCEVKISSSNKKSHIEHIEPKDKIPNKFKDYKNLVVSCNEKNTCGNYKGNSYSEDFINPVLENPEEYLTYDLMTGEVISRDSLETKEKLRAEYTIKILNLNYTKLKDIRLRFILESLKMIECLDSLEEFPSLLKEVKRRFKEKG